MGKPLDLRDPDSMWCPRCGKDTNENDWRCPYCFVWQHRECRGPGHDEAASGPRPASEDDLTNYELHLLLEQLGCGPRHRHLIPEVRVLAAEVVRLRVLQRQEKTQKGGLL